MILEYHNRQTFSHTIAIQLVRIFTFITYLIDYQILTGILNGSASLGSESGNNRGGIAAGLSLKQNFQSEKIGETEVLYNFNGLSEWQHFNGVSMNQGCGTIGSDSSSASSATPSQKTDYYFRDSQIVSH